MKGQINLKTCYDDVTTFSVASRDTIKLELVTSAKVQSVKMNKGHQFQNLGWEGYSSYSLHF
jgi:hypothetical protein